MNERKPRTGFPTWAAPGIGLVVGTFLAYATLLQNEPLSPFPPMTTLGIGAAIGCVAGGLVGLGEHLRR